ncbi:MAG: hypothetical protein AAGA75_26670 [Cyanobacteria bacterium P01_E01_bin.6]
MLSEGWGDRPLVLGCRAENLWRPTANAETRNRTGINPGTAELDDRFVVEYIVQWH